MTQARSDLIYDIGLLDGEDTTYYLFRGYNVVAVDANSLMVEQARLRFAGAIESKRLTLLNCRHKRKRRARLISRFGTVDTLPTDFPTLDSAVTRRDEFIEAAGLSVPSAQAAPDRVTDPADIRLA